MAPHAPTTRTNENVPFRIECRGLHGTDPAGPPLREARKGSDPAIGVQRRPRGLPMRLARFKMRTHRKPLHPGPCWIICGPSRLRSQLGKTSSRKQAARSGNLNHTAHLEFGSLQFVMFSARCFPFHWNKTLTVQNSCPVHHGFPLRLGLCSSDCRWPASPPKSIPWMRTRRRMP